MLDVGYLDGATDSAIWLRSGTGMTRGIHLKRLTNTHLEALGLKDEQCGQDAGEPAAGARSPTLLEEVDPVLSRIVGEVRVGLEGTLQVLNQALAIDLIKEDG